MFSDESDEESELCLVVVCAISEVSGIVFSHDAALVDDCVRCMARANLIFYLYTINTQFVAWTLQIDRATPLLTLLV